MILEFDIHIHITALHHFGEEIRTLCGLWGEFGGLCPVSVNKQWPFGRPMANKSFAVETAKMCGYLIWKRPPHKTPRRSVEIAENENTTSYQSSSRIAFVNHLNLVERVLECLILIIILVNSVTLMKLISIIFCRFRDVRIAVKCEKRLKNLPKFGRNGYWTQSERSDRRSRGRVFSGYVRRSEATTSFTRILWRRSWSRLWS